MMGRNMFLDQSQKKHKSRGSGGGSRFYSTDGNKASQYNKKVSYNRLAVQKAIFKMIAASDNLGWTTGMILEKLKMDPIDKKIVEGSLSVLNKQGLLYCHAGKSSVSKNVNLNGKKFKGTFYLSARGFGFVTLYKRQDNSDTNKPTIDGNVFVSKLFTNGAMSQDEVEVVVIRNGHKGYEGMISKILHQASVKLVCNIVKPLGERTFLGYHPGFTKTSLIIHIDDIGDREIKTGDRVLSIVQRDKWGDSVDSSITKMDSMICKASRVLGSIENASLDIEAVMLEKDICNEFDQDVIDYVNMKFDITEEGHRDVVVTDDREDMQDLLTITIDPVTSKDFDDAISLVKSDEGYDLYVHIADVAHYVEQDSIVDNAAKGRLTSVYFPGTCVPMLPSLLSDDLCSLVPHKKRYACSLKIKIDQDGQIVGHKFMKSVIVSDHRLTYTEAKDMLEKDISQQEEDISKICIMLQNMKELAEKLKGISISKGLLDFSLKETVVIVDDGGNPTNIEQHDYDITHQMIETFMVLANRITADCIEEKFGKGIGLFRVHPKPDKEDESHFIKQANLLGAELTYPLDKAKLQKVIDNTASDAVKNMIITLYIQHMKQAVYSAHNMGHYGLSISSYCHFTSPIRRYADVVMHRLINKIVLGNNDKDIVLSKEDYELLAENCSLRERIASSAENQVSTMKKLRLLKSIMEQEGFLQVVGLIIGISEFFVTVLIEEFGMDGKIHVSNLSGFFEYSMDTHVLYNSKDNVTLNIGKEIDVSLLYVDLIKMHVEWAYK